MRHKPFPETPRENSAWMAHRRIQPGGTPGSKDDFLAGFRAAKAETGAVNTDRLVGRYVNRLFKLACFPDIMASKIFPNVKELTESMAAVYAVFTHLNDDVDPADPNVSLVSVGDGSTPRTASLFAFMTKWTCVSVDPKLKQGPWLAQGQPIRRLSLHTARIQDFQMVFDRPLVITAVHSHAPIPATLQSLCSLTARHLVTIPCCTDLSVPDREPDVEYSDPHCWSSQRTVRVYRNV